MSDRTEALIGLALIVLLAVTAWVAYRWSRADDSNQRRNLSGAGPADLKGEYQQLVSMIQVEAQLFWSNVAAFLVVETVLLALVGSVLVGSNGPHVGPVPALLMAVLGLVVSVFWLAVVLRMSAYHVLRVLQAKELERDGENGVPYRIFTTGAALSHDGEAHADGKRVRTTRLGRIPTRLSVILVVLSFSALRLAPGLKIAEVEEDETIRGAPSDL